MKQLIELRYEYLRKFHEFNVERLQEAAYYKKAAEDLTLLIARDDHQ